MQQVDTISKFVDMFKANGPFFFSIFLAMLWIWTIKKSINLYNNKDGDKTLRITMLTFSFIFLVGSLIVAWKAINWWNTAQKTPFGRYATVLDVPEEINIFSDNRELYQKRIDNHAGGTHSIRLAFLSKQVCKESDEFYIQLHREGMNQPDKFILKCIEFDEDWPDQKSYAVTTDSKGNLILNSLSQASSNSGSGHGNLFPLIGPAYAEDSSRNGRAIQSSTIRNYVGINNLDKIIDAAKILQSDQAKPGEKLEVIGQLSNSEILADNMINERLIDGLTEPLYATLLDLQRHSDKQLSIKAKLLLTKLPLFNDIVRLSKSHNKKIKGLNKIVSSLSNDDLSKITDTTTKNAILSIYNENEWVRKKLNAPVPTYTKDGDRFFVKASWDNKNNVVVGCIGRAYYDVWGGDSLQQQTELVRSKTSRTVYYTKAWSYLMADKLKHCSAQVSFVQGYSDESMNAEKRTKRQQRN